jgi:protein-S-isoprenylcysteine O-methyltransferase Ste14
MSIPTRIIDFGERAFVAILYLSLLVRLVPRISLQPHTLLFLTSELLVLLFILIRRRGECAESPYAMIIAFVGTAAPMLVHGGGGAAVSNDLAGTFILVGLVLTVWSKLVLRRSFGIIAANRGVKVNGPYRIVRHPMYLGYMISQAAFLLTNLRLWNVTIYLAGWIAQILRINEEEKILSKDPIYQSFAKKVRARLIPGVY